MKLSYEDHESISVLTVSGELIADQADPFRRAVQERFESGIRDIIVDMEYLTLVDSAGLELLLWLQDEAGVHNGRLRLVNPDETIHKILSLTRLDHRFTVCDDVESAARGLR